MIFISAGHYPHTKGASFGDFYEYPETMLWAIEIQGLIEMSSDLVPTGNLRSKIDYINENAEGQDLAIEIHFNSAKNIYGTNIGRGCETLYCPNSIKGRDFAVVINDAMARHMRPARGVKAGYYQMNPDKGPDAFLGETNCPAIIIEPDFIHRKKLIQDNREVCCASIAASLIAVKEELFK